MSQIQIPRNWKLVKLGELGEYKYGYNGKASSDKSGKPYLRITDINSDGSLKQERVYVQISEDDFQKYSLQKNDLVIARTGATVGKSFLFKGSEDFVFASYLIRYRFDQKRVLPEFLQYVLRSPAFWNFIGINQSASAQPNVNATKMSKFEFSLPPLETQKKIVQKLDHILGQLEEKKKEILELQKMKLKYSELLSDNFMSFLIAELIPTENYPSHWKSTDLGETFNEVKDKWQPNSKSEKLNYIGLENIESNTGKLVEFTPTNSLEIKSSKTYFSKNDVLYGKLRPYLNKVLLPNFDGVCSTDIIVLKPKPNITREFLAYFLRSYHVLSIMTKLMYGTKMPRAKIQDLQDVKIGLPDEKEQQQIVKKLQDSEKIVGSVKQSVNKITIQQEELAKYLQYLQSSILDKAFSGKLVN